MKTPSYPLPFRLHSGRGALTPVHLLLAFSAALAAAGCGRGPEHRQDVVAEEELGGGGSQLFVDVAAQAGLVFRYMNGMTGEFYYHEIMGGGSAFLDFDNDGDLDVYLVQGHPIEGSFSPATDLLSSSDAGSHRDRLFRNDLSTRDGRSSGLSFVDVTAASGIVATGYGIGVATGDVDNDGWIDLFISNYGPNQLWHNNGDGTFTDVTSEVGVVDRVFSTSASFVDFDGDGWLDLYVAGYIQYDHQKHRLCLHHSGAGEYCSPLSYQPELDRLYRNRGDGSFEDFSIMSGVASLARPGLGVVASDVDGTGRLDLYVTNDVEENTLWVNQGPTAFLQEAVIRGAAVNSRGRTEASMGVQAGDFDGDGDDDLFAAHMNRQSSTLYVNLGGGYFEDWSVKSGLGAATWKHTMWAPVWLDYDNDGWLDLLAVNGGMTVFNDVAPRGDPHPLRDPNQLFRNLGGMKFEEVTESAGPVFELAESGRGGATGDVDNDGDVDVLISNNEEPVRLLINQVGNDHYWLGLRLLGREERRDMLGAYVEVLRESGPRLVRRVATDGSYCSASDPRVLVGLGVDERILAVQVRWPSGEIETFDPPEINRYHTLVEGTGRSVSDN